MNDRKTLDVFLTAELEKLLSNAPSVLQEAVFSAVFPGGGRVRPQFTMIFPPLTMR